MQGETRVSVPTPSIILSPPLRSKRQPRAPPVRPIRLLRSGFIVSTVRHALGWALVALLVFVCVDAGIEGYKSTLTELSAIRRHHLPIARQASLFFDAIQSRITEAAADGTVMTLLVLSSLLLAVAWTVEAVLLAMHEANGGSRVLLKGSSC